MTTLASSASDPSNPPVYGQPITFTATISLPNAAYGTPTGSVDFCDETTGTDLGTVAQLTNSLDGTYGAALSVANLDVEDHYVTATYSGDSTFASSASDPYDQEVPAGTTSVTVPTSATYASGLVQLHATVSVVTGEGTPTGSVEFYNGATDLGAGTAGSAGQWSLTTSAVPPGNQTITAVYSGDDSFSGSQSTATVNVVGETISIGTLYVTSGGSNPSMVYVGDTAILSGSVSNLDGAAFMATVYWGGSQNGQDFYFSAGATSFAVSHYVDDQPAGNSPVNYPISVTVTTSDGRSANASPGVATKVYDVAPTGVVTGLPADPPSGPSAYDLSVVVYAPRQDDLSYQWNLTDQEGTFASDTSEFQFTATPNEVAGVTLTVSDINGGSWFWMPLTGAGTLKAKPSVSISETDAGQTVLGGNNASFDIHADAGSSQATSPVTVFYRTIDPTGSAPMEYAPTGGPVEVTFNPSDFKNPTGADWVADKTFTIATAGGIYDGLTTAVTVQLSNPYLCQLASGGGDQATANIVEPYIEMTTPTTMAVSAVNPATGTAVTATVIVGQQITLAVEVPAPFVSANCQWTVSGQTVASYVQNTTSTTLTTLSADNTCWDQVQFYWIAGGNETATCDFDVGAVHYHETANFVVAVPGSNFTAATTSNQSNDDPAGPVGVGPDEINPYDTLHYGTGGPGHFGISWTASATADAAEGGSIQVVRLVDSTEWFTPGGAFPRTTVVGTFGNYVLDAYPAPGAYEIQQPPRDLTTGQLEPGTGVLPVGANQTATLTSIDNPFMSLAGNTAVGGTARYVTYLMYKPDTPNSIWVTLQTITWGWGGSATLGPNGWSLNPGSYPGNPYIRMVGMTISTLPQWIKDWPDVSESPATRISGIVTDAQGLPVAGAVVTATWAGVVGPDILTATTDSKGQYNIYGAFGAAQVSLSVAPIGGVTFPGASVTPGGAILRWQDFAGVGLPQ